MTRAAIADFIAAVCMIAFVYALVNGWLGW